jgi:ABC-type Zn uptake system ZnuABC Zn-binding protein ZnuA
LILALAAVAAAGVAVRSAATAPAQKIRVAAVTADLGAIVQRVGSADVAVTSLLKGCILRPDLQVEAGALDALFAADAVVWSGLFHESAAIHAAVSKLPVERRATLSQPLWIDVSHGAARVNVPTSSCEGFVEIQFMHGDPFFWLNPENGAVIARNVAEGLARLRPEHAEMYAANAETFAAEMAASIERWRAELAPLAGTKVFVAQCGWANLSRLGGPVFMSCRTTPGTLARPEVLAEQVAAQEVPIVVVDPNTPREYAETFRARTRAAVVVIPSSLADLPGARTYPALFDNVVKSLLQASGKPAPAGAVRHE